MAIREIITTENPILRRKAKKIVKVTPELRALADDMLETMREAPGVGLAAPQVAQSVRLFVAELEENEENPGSGKTYVVFNPEYIFKSDEMVDGVEGCLSIPGWAGEVTRHHKIVVKGLDRQGKRVRIEAEGWQARVFQHEIDHLDGVLFPDRISAPEKIWEIEVGQEEQVEKDAARAAQRMG
jgi:peptide deformylase